MKLSANGSDFSKASDDELRRALADMVDQLSFIVNGNIGLLDNVKVSRVKVSFTSANTNLYVPHTLGRVPKGYIVTSLSAAMIVYNGTSEWTGQGIYLRSSAIGDATLLVF